MIGNNVVSETIGIENNVVILNDAVKVNGLMKCLLELYFEFFLLFLVCLVEICNPLDLRYFLKKFQIVFHTLAFVNEK